jgi:hypothetical protein
MVVGTRLDDGGQRHVRDLGGIAGLGERPRRGGERAADALHVAAAGEVALGGRVGFRAARERRGRQQLGVGGPRLSERPIGFDEQ